MKSFNLLAPAVQEACHEPPYDRWISHAGGVVAEFYRRETGFLVRFPEQADFHIDSEHWTVCCCPVPGLAHGFANTLFHNSICPLLSNHNGELNLHASGVDILGVAVAFVGDSRSGKTTLAGAFARCGHPLLTEDVLALPLERGRFGVTPARPVLRLFPDSASYLLGEDGGREWNDCKVEIEVGDKLPIAAGSAPLAAIFLLSSRKQLATSVERVAPAQALAELIRHAFILDVEDKKFLRSHFVRLGELAQAVPCYKLDYPRNYDHLSEVINTVRQTIADNGTTHETD